MAGDADSPIISVVLLLTEEDSRVLSACSAAFGAAAPSSISLGAGSIPHITVVQFAAPAEDAERLWDSVKHLDDAVKELTASGVCFIPESERDRTWVEVRFLKSAAASALQAEVLSQGEALGLTVSNTSHGDLYRPHCTLALLEGKRTVAVDLSEFPLLRQTLQVRLAVGINGEHGTLDTIVRSV